MASNFRANAYEGGLTVDPTAGAGVVAEIGSILPRRGTTELWQKFGAGNTDWQLISTTGAVVSGDGYSFYGTGIDGDMVFDGVNPALGFAGLSLAPAAGVYTLTRCIFANSITISGGATVIGNGFRIFCLNTLDNAGLIHCDGPPGVAGTLTNGGAGGVAITTKVLAGGTNGVPGGNAGGGLGAGGIAPAGPSQLGAAVGIGAAGSNGGTFQGGGGGRNNIPADGGTVAALAAFAPNQSPNYHSILQSINARDISGTNPITNGSSGGSGRASSTINNGGSGGSGASAGTLVICARVISGAGTIAARGGAGGAAGGVNAGGSGGSSGGTIVIVTDSRFPLSNALSVAGGLGSAAGGAAGTTAGGNGGSGMIYRFNPRR